MSKKRHKPEEIVAKLRQVDVLASQGVRIADAIRQIGVSEVTYYRWRQEYGGLKSDQVKRLKALETENARLRGDDPPPLKWSDSKYGFRPEEDLGWQGRDTSRKRLLRSYARWMSWPRRVCRLPMRSARLA